MRRRRGRCRALLALAVVCGGCAAPPAAPAPALPDLAAYHDAARRLNAFDPGGRIAEIDWSADGRTLSFTRLGESLTFDLERRVFVDPGEDDEDDGEGDDDELRRRRPRRGHQRDREPSPDGRWSAVCRDFDVILEEAEGEEAIEVTTDGHRKLRYGRASWVYGEELDQVSAMWWSPDSRRLVFYEFDERDVPDFYLVEGLTGRHTAPLVEGYPKPGDPNPVASLLVYDLETRETSPIETSPIETAGEGGQEWYVYDVRFAPKGELLFNRTTRRQDLLQVVAVDLETRAARIVVEERQGTWQENRPTMRFLADGERFIWETERSGCPQLELRHLDGRRLHALSAEGHPVADIEHVDEERGVLLYTAWGGSHPLDLHLHRVSLDGTGGRRVTREAGHHAVEVSPDGRWIVTRSETLSTPPVTALRESDGTFVCELARSDPQRLAGLGMPPAELFSFTADDGATEIFGWLHKPPGFDPGRTYPLLIDVYGGPQSRSVPNTWRAGHPACALGFVVAAIDNRGTTGRGKAFESAVYLRLGSVDLADQVAGVRHLLRRRFLDPERVGIYGHSYGGYLAALAILKHPELFRAAVAASPVTDWRNYDTIYTERYMRTPQENPEGYDEGSCLTHAGALEGHLLIEHGMLDDNVHPNNAWQLIDALRAAGKRVDVALYPDATHRLGRSATDARWEHLCRHLGAEAP